MADDQNPGSGQDPRHPKSTYGAKYPMNRVIVTESGHEFHLDDTQGKERVRLAHKTGSYEEVNEKGRRTQLTVDNLISYVKGGSTHTTDKNSDRKVGGSDRLNVTGDRHTEIKGTQSTAVSGHSKMTVGEDMVMAVKGDSVTGVKGKSVSKIGGMANTKIDGTNHIIVDGQATYEHGKGVTYTAQEKITFKVGGSEITMEPGKITMKSAKIALN